MRFKEGTLPWMEVMSPAVFKENPLIQLVEQCGVRQDLRSCTEVSNPGRWETVVFSITCHHKAVFYANLSYISHLFGKYHRGFLLPSTSNVTGTNIVFFQTDGMHPAVIFVIAVIGIFSVAIFSGVVVFIVVFYQQMEYEGYKKGFLHNIIT